MATAADRVAAQAGVERQSNYERLTKAQRAELGVVWVEPIHMADLEAGELVKLEHPEDIATLGKLQRHCSGTHFVWVCQEKIWHFFTVLDEKANPLLTLHAKDVEWLGKTHPRMNGKSTGLTYSPNGGYVTYSDLLNHCKLPEVFIDPEANDYKPPVYANTTYDANMNALRWGVVKEDVEIDFPPFEEWCKTQREWNRTPSFYEYAKTGGTTANNYRFRPALIVGKHMAAMSCNGSYADKSTKPQEAVKQVQAWWTEQLDENGELVDASKIKAEYW